MDKLTTCFCFDSMALWNGIDPTIIHMTYKVMHSYYLQTEGVDFTDNMYKHKIYQCNQQDVLACTTLMTAFRVTWKFIDDNFDHHLLKQMTESWLTFTVKDWLSLEYTFMSSIGWNIMSILGSDIQPIHNRILKLKGLKAI